MCYFLSFLVILNVLYILVFQLVFFFLILSVIIILGNFIISVDSLLSIVLEIKYIMKDFLFYFKCIVFINDFFFYREYDIL